MSISKFYDAKIKPALSKVAFILNDVLFPLDPI